jgi:kanamycin nucleotidyltransferase
MEHPERERLAWKISENMVSEYGDEIILSGVYGSTARGNDTAYSDLEMMVIVTPECSLESRDFLFKDIAVGLSVYPEDRLKTILSEPDLKTPFICGVLDVMKIIHGEETQKDRYLKIVESVPKETFKRALHVHLPTLVWESYGRILSCQARGNDENLMISIYEMLLEMNLALCLLNGSWVFHDYFQGIIDAYRFPKLPADYEALTRNLWFCRNIDEAANWASELVDNFRALLKAESISIENYESLA